MTEPMLAEIVFRGRVPAAAAVALIAAAGVGSALLYFRESVRMALAARVGLASLRVLAFATLGVLLMRPVWVREVSEDRPRPVAVLLDESESMTLRDPRGPRDTLRAAVAFDARDPAAPLPAEPMSADDIEAVADKMPENPSRAEVAAAALKSERLDLLGRLRRNHPVRTARFGRKARPVSDLLDGYAPKEPSTALYEVAREQLLRDPDRLPAALVAVTDGRDNASGVGLADLARECVARGVPLHIYGVGTAELASLRLRSARVAEALFVDDEAAVEATFLAKGVPSGEVELSLELGGRAVGKPRRVAFRAGEPATATLTFVPLKSQALTRKQDLRVRARLIDGDAADAITKPVRVADAKVRVLVIDHAPRPDYRFLQRALLRDRRVEAKFFLVAGDEREMRAGDPYLPKMPEGRRELFGFDLLVLGDVAAADLPGALRKAIRDFVSEGRGLVAVAGRRRAPATWADADLADLLPVEFAAKTFPSYADEPTEPYRPALTDAGRDSPMLSLAGTAGANDELWRELPGWHWHYPVTRLRPGAVSLLRHPREKAGDDPMPLMAARYFGRGRVLFVATDETWRWRENREEEVFGRFWGQVVYAMGLPGTAGGRGAVLTLSDADATVGEPGRVFARLFDGDFEPLTRPKVPARVERLAANGDVIESRDVELEAVPGRPGDYAAELPHDEPGRFVLRVDVGEPASAEYRVRLPEGHELDREGLAVEEMRRLAEQSGGRFYREEDLRRLPDAVEPRSATVTERAETLLWNWWAFVLLVGLLTAEWVGRKFANLS